MNNQISRIESDFNKKFAAWERQFKVNFLTEKLVPKRQRIISLSDLEYELTALPYVLKYKIEQGFNRSKIFIVVPDRHVSNMVLYRILQHDFNEMTMFMPIGLRVDFEIVGISNFRNELHGIVLNALKGLVGSFDMFSHALKNASQKMQNLLILNKNKN